MPITLPNLDDRKYEDLVQEALALIPTYAPEWTNHNASDPGITLVEMFAYLSEMLIYRLNRVTDANTAAFLKLIDGVDRRGMSHEALVNEIRNVVLDLRRPERAVTAADFEELVLRGFPGKVARAHCVAGLNLEPDNEPTRDTPRAGNISVIITPESTDSKPFPSNDLIGSVKTYLDPRRLLTTKVHVVGPRYITVGVRITIIMKSDWIEKNVRNEAVSALRSFLSPLTGGSDGKGWPFGRNVYVSEIYDLLDRLPGVDFVTRTTDPRTSKPLPELTVTDSKRIIRNSANEVIAVEVRMDELVEASIQEAAITVLSP